MSCAVIETTRLRLVPYNPAKLLAAIEAMQPNEKAQVSADWLARVRSANAVDPWILGFELIDRASNVAIGKAGFKGPPGKDGIVELAYGLEPDWRGKGYATEAARALVTFAFNTGQVCLVRAHTLPEPNASTRVLRKCGFQLLGDVVDPEDGPVWRWEKQK